MSEFDELKSAYVRLEAKLETAISYIDARLDWLGREVKYLRSVLEGSRTPAADQRHREEDQP